MSTSRRCSLASKLALPVLLVVSLAALWSIGAGRADASEEGIVAAYPLDKGEGTVAADPRGGNHGTIVGAKWTAAGAFGKALEFDGSGDCLTASMNSWPGLGTFEAWIRPDTTGPWPLVSTPGSEFPSNFLISGASAGLGLFSLAENTSGFTEGGVGASIPANTWSHIAFTNAEPLAFYVNGTPIEMEGLPSLMPVGGFLEFGCSPELGSFDGRIDEIRIYGRALSQGEIEEDMVTAVGSGGSPESTPEVETLAASELKTTKAKLNGKVHPKGLTTSYYFEYGTTTSYGSNIPALTKNVSGVSFVEVAETPTGLSPSTTYHYRLSATNSSGSQNGADKTFTTAAPPNTIIDAGPTAPSTNTTPKFEYHSTDGSATFECRVDGSSWKSCPGSGYTIPSPLADGSHTFEIKSIDPLGVADPTPASRTFIVDTVDPTVDFASELKGGGFDYFLQIDAADGGATPGGIDEIQVLLNGVSDDGSEPECSEAGVCPKETGYLWEHEFSEPPEGGDEATVIAIDAAGNSTSDTFEIPSAVYHAVVYDKNPGSGGVEVAEEWAQLGTHSGRFENAAETATRNTEACVDKPAEACSFLRRLVAGEAPVEERFTETFARADEVPDAGEVTTLALPRRGGFEEVGSGPIGSVAAGWQTLPPGAGSTYIELEGLYEPEEEGLPSTDWTFWVDAATMLPIKASIQSGEGSALLSYYDYDAETTEASDLPANFFRLQKPGIEPAEACIASGQIGGWAYSPNAFVNSDPHFESILMTADGPVSVKPTDAAADGYEGRAELTEDGIEISALTGDEEELVWEVNSDAEQSLETAGENVVVVEPGGSPTALIVPNENAEVVDGEANLETGESNDEIVLASAEGSASATIEPLSSPGPNAGVCITEEDQENAAVIYEEAMEAKLEALGTAASGSAPTTQVKVWINPHPALAGVSVEDKYGACNGPATKSFGVDGWVLYGGCPVGKSVTLVVPNPISTGGYTYTTGDPSRTFKPPAGGYSVDFNYQGTPIPPKPKPPWYRPASVIATAMTVTEENEEALASGPGGIPGPAPGELTIPEGVDCAVATGKPYFGLFPPGDPNRRMLVMGALKFRCVHDAFVVYWRLTRKLFKFNSTRGEYVVRTEKSTDGVQLSDKTVRPAPIREVCNDYAQSEPQWKHVSEWWGLFEKPERGQESLPLKTEKFRAGPCG